MLKTLLVRHWIARYILAALLGATGVLCFAPADLFWLAPLVWAGFFALLQHAPTPRQAMFSGFGFGLGLFLVGVSWIYVSLSTFGGMPWWLAGPATLLFCAAMALYPALASWLFKRWQPADFGQQALYFGALIAATDWLRSWIFTGFPWLTLGYTQTPPSPLAGFAPLLGVFGISLLVALSGALLLRWRIGLTALTLLGLCGFGLQQVRWTSPVGEPVSVALIQGNVPQEMKFRPEAFFRTLDLYHDLIEQNPAQLTLLPETAFPAFIDQVPTAYLDLLRGLAARQNGDIVVGSVSGDRERYFNSAISLGQSPSQTYSKQHLVPFGEFIPAGFSWFMQLASIPMSSFTRGAETQPPLNVTGHQVAINICYEDVFGDEIIRSLPQAGILANLSNTAWFGDSLAQPQHLQIARLRALETGRPMLRATNTGMTAIVNADGQIQAVLAPFSTGVLKGEVRAHQGMTPYARLGNGLALGLIAACALLGQIRRRQRSN